MKFFKWLILLGGLVLAGIFYVFYFPNYSDKETKSIYIPTGSNYEQVLDTLEKYAIIKQRKTFDITASLLKYATLVRPGKYNIDAKSGNLAWIRKIRNGVQDPVKITLSNVDSPQELAQRLGKKLEKDSIDFIKILLDSSNKDGFTPDNRWGVFLCNTYEMYWTSTPDKVMQRMENEFKNYFGEKNTAKAKSLGLSPMQIIILASIVQKETYKTDEQGTIARVYLNRLDRGMLLQADPTVKFAVGDPTIRRVLNKDLSVDSPYNTYKYAGLTPGPLCLPELTCVKEVLNAPQNDYLFFCAKADFSGYHAFATTAAEHQRNAQEFYKAQNERKIYR